MSTSSRWFTLPNTTSTRSSKNIKPPGNKLVPMSLEIIDSSAPLSPSSLSKKNIKRSPETKRSVAPCMVDVDTFINEPIELAINDGIEEEKGIDANIPNIIWNDPSPIESGIALSSKQLNAECDLKYSDYQWMYDPPEGIFLSTGTHVLSVDLCYFRDGEIQFLSKRVQITVLPRKSFSRPALTSVLPSVPSSSSTSNSDDVPVPSSPSSIRNIARRIFNWSPSNKTSPTAAAHGSSGGMTIKWNDPESIAVGKVLTKQQLNATVTPFISGQYIYKPDLGTRLPLGRHKLSVEFRPESKHREFFTPEKKLTKIVYIEVLNKRSLDNEALNTTTTVEDAVIDCQPNPHEIPVKKSMLNYCRKDFSRHLKINSSYTAVTPAHKCPTPKKEIENSSYF